MKETGHNFSDTASEKNAWAAVENAARTQCDDIQAVDTALPRVVTSANLPAGAGHPGHHHIRRCAEVQKNTGATDKNEFLNLTTITSLFFTPTPRLTDSFRTIFPGKKKLLTNQLMNTIYSTWNFANHR